jgi:hypothetical protein
VSVLIAGLVSTAVSVALMAAGGVFTPLRGGDPPQVSNAVPATPDPQADVRSSAVADPTLDPPPLAEKTEATLAVQPPSKPARPKGSVQVTGDATDVVLIDARGRPHSPRREAKLPVGVYDLHATFEDGTTITRERFIEVRNAETTSVRCQGDVQNCFAG